MIRRREAGRKRVQWAMLATACVLLVVGSFWASGKIATAARARLVDELSSRVTAFDVGFSHEIGLRGVAIGPVRLLDPSAGREVLVEIRRVRVRPKLLPLLVGRVELGAVMLENVRLTTSDSDRLTKLLKAKSDKPSSQARPGSHRPIPPVYFTRLEIEDLALPTMDGALTVERIDGETTVSGIVQLESGANATVTAVHGPKGTSVEGAIEELAWTDVPERLRPSGLSNVRTASLSMSFQATGASAFKSGKGRVSLTVANVTADDPRIHPEPVGPFSATVEGAVEWDRIQRSARLSAAKVSLGALQVATVDAEGSLGSRTFRTVLELGPVDYADLVDALPAGLRPPSSAPKVKGPLRGKLSLAGQVGAPEQWVADASLDLTGMRDAARKSAAVLAGSFLHHAPLPDGAYRELVVGPENRRFVPVDELPEYVVRAVTVSEDAGFFAHQGFDVEEMKRSLLDDRRLRGASTISQQLAKNLYLTPDRTYARKVQEALVTIALEAALSKRRLIEVYLNIIEWGPGIHGIGEAAGHYFDKDPRSLTPKEAAFLASLIPSPQRYHAFHVRGISEKWQERLTDILDKLHRTGQLSADEHGEALGAPLEFAEPTGRCVAQRS